MPYKIKHQSRNECLIKYAEGDDPKRKNRVGLPIFAFGLIAVLFGMHFIIVTVLLSALLFALNRHQPPRDEFEIELNRPRNRIAIRNTKQRNSKSTVYPLNYFKGFAFRQIGNASNDKHRARSVLFFEFDNRIKTPLATNNGTLIERAEQVSEIDGDTYWQVPIRETDHVVPTLNAVDIVEATADWLVAAEETKIEAKESFDALPQETEIFRDFRDMKESESEPD